MGYTLAEAIAIPTALLIIGAAAWVLHHFLGQKSERVRTIPLTVLAIIILVGEVIKQWYHLGYKQDWTPWDLPVHFCSFFLVWFLFALCSRGAVRQIAYSCCLSGGILVTLMLICAPRMIVQNACSNIFASFGTVHTFFFHMIVVAYWVWMLALDLYQPQKRHIWQTTLLYLGYFCVILIAAYLLNTNYTNALYTDIAPLEYIRVHAGQVAYTLVMFGLGTAGIAGLSTAMYFATTALLKHRRNDNYAHK